MFDDTENATISHRQDEGNKSHIRAKAVVIVLMAN